MDKLRQQADDQEATLVAQEEEVQGKKRELEELKDEEKSLLEEIKRSEKELLKLEQNLNLAQELRREVRSREPAPSLGAYDRLLRCLVLDYFLVRG